MPHRMTGVLHSLTSNHHHRQAMAIQAPKIHRKLSHKSHPLPQLSLILPNMKQQNHRPKTRRPRKPLSNMKFRRARRTNHIVSIRARREHLAQAAQDTLATLSFAGQQDNAIQDLSANVIRSRQETAFYPHQSPLLANWSKGQPLSSRLSTSTDTKFEFVSSSALSNAQSLSSSSTSERFNGSIGVLNATSPKRPGGAYLSGGSAQEECLARQTTIFDSLQNSDAGASFYAEHRSASDGSGLHDHSMLYSPQVVVFKDDLGYKISPFTVDVLSCVPVNASTVRSKFNIDPQYRESGIRSVMKERMARILRLFEERGVGTLVLGAFGAGQFCNSPDMIGELWADLLLVRGARFRNSFDKVVFALPGKHRLPFESAFNSRVLESDLLQALDDNEVD